MGYNSAHDMAAHTDVRSTVSWHLSANCYPPVPASMVNVCVDAIDAMIAGDSDEQIHLPEGTLYKGQESAPAWAVMENFRLEGIIDAIIGSMTDTIEGE